MRSIFGFLFAAFKTLFMLAVQFFAEPDPNASQLSASSPYPVGKVTPGGPGASVQASPTVYSTSGAITQKNGKVVLNGVGVQVMTLAAPIAGPASAGGDDGSELTIISASPHAHTVTTPAHAINDGTSTTKDTATFPAYAGARLALFAFNGAWYASAASTLAPAVLSEV